MIRRTPRVTRTVTLCPYTTLVRASFRSSACDSQRSFGVLAIRLIPRAGFFSISPRRTACSRIECNVDIVRAATPSPPLVAPPRLPCLGLEVTPAAIRSEEHTSELQSLMRISYAVFCLKKQNKQTHDTYKNVNHRHTSTP